MITIHYNFTDGTEVSYIEGLKLKDNFTTNCLDFFSFDIETEDVIILDNKGKKLSRNKLLESNDYTLKQITEKHNIQKMLKAGAFSWR